MNQNHLPNKKQKITEEEYFNDAPTGDLGEEFFNDASEGDLDLWNKVEGDFALVKATKNAIQAGNCKSKEFSEYLTNKVLDSFDSLNWKCMKTPNQILPPGFTGEELTVNKLKELCPELRKFIAICEVKGIDIHPFLQVYLLNDREEGSEQGARMKWHRDKPSSKYRGGREPFVRIGLTRFAHIKEEDEIGGLVKKKFGWRRIVEGSNKFDRVTVEIEDGDVLFLGPKEASGKFKAVEHQPTIYQSNSISVMADILLPEGSKFKDFAVPQFAQYFVDKGAFEHKPDGYNLKFEKPGFWKNVDNSQQRKAGFQNNKYRYNRGHWKLFDEANDGTVNVYDFGEKGTQKLLRKLDKHYATDFIVDRGIDFIQEHAQAEEPFALFLSIPDPHSPMVVREPYNLLYNTTDFDPVIPRTTKKMIQADPSPPSFYQQPRQKDKKIKTMSRSVWKNKGEQEFRELLKEFKDVNNFDEHLRQYFGMVKLLDDKIGDLLSKVEELNIEENSIIVFTSDHGKLLFEHGKSNKGEPFFTSAGIPMLVKWPQKIKKGKIVETAYSSVDFAPTLLGLLNITDLPVGMKMHGVDGSNEILNSLDISSNDSKIVFSYRSSGRWIAAIKDGYKLVLNKKYKSDGPYLFDLNIDPDELMNFANSAAHKQIFEELKDALIEWIYEYEFLDADKINLYLDTPSCIDSKNVLHNEGTSNHLPDLIFCSDIGSKKLPQEVCLVEEIREHCPVTCKSRCPDSDGMMMFRNKVVQCKELRDGCYDERVRNFCPRTCRRDSCRDDLEFKFFVKENMKRRCEFILTNNKMVAALRRKKFCADENIASKCRWSCGGCNNSIFDDDSFTFGGTGILASDSAGQDLPRGYSYSMNCSWLTSNIRRRATRQKRFCPRVKSNCALSCGNY